MPIGSITGQCNHAEPGRLMRATRNARILCGLVLVTIAAFLPLRMGAIAAVTPELRPLTETPDKQAIPPREKIERALRLQLEEWDRRISAYALAAHGRSEHRLQALANAADLEEALWIVKQQWQKLVQTRGEDWESAKHRFDVAYADLLRLWQELPAAE